MEKSQIYPFITTVGIAFMCIMMIRQELASNQKFRKQTEDIELMKEQLASETQSHYRRKRSVVNSTTVVNNANTIIHTAHLVSSIPRQYDSRNPTQNGHAENVQNRDGLTIGSMINGSFDPTPYVGDHYYKMFELDSENSPSNGILNHTHGEKNSHVLQDGVYLLYFHITYWIRSLTAGFGVEVNGSTRVKCIISQRVTERFKHLKVEAPTPCSTTFTTVLRKGDQISIRSLYNRNRAILHKSRFTYWGLVRLADLHV